jgi:DNA-binding NtrC family response regulator
MTSQTPRAQVLIVDDEADHADVMADALRKPGHISTIVNSVDAAYDELGGGAFDIVITDLRMPSSTGQHGTAADGGDAGLRVLAGARRMQPLAETIMVTAHGDVATARAAFKHGVFDFIEKPLDLEVFRSLVNRAAETVLLRHEMIEDEGAQLDELVQHEGFKGIIAGSEPMRKILQTVKTMGASTLPVLVTGESGTGKELIARALHNVSDRAKKRFVALNCAAETESLLEDQLFGHVKGAYTGAEKDREGVFEYATDGTLFLDEIGDMPASMQAKLLRVLETGEVVRLGSNDPRLTDVRLVSATNQNLEQAVKEGVFREDLYFRIAGASIHLPPLRERRDDIPRIIRHAIAEHVEKASPGMAPLDISDAALLRLTSFHWPGNVRQLLNVTQNMVVQALADGSTQLDTQHIPEQVRATDEPEDTRASVGSLAGASLQQLEKRAIRETLRLTKGNREQAATMLGIGERTLYRKLKEYGLR